MSPAATVKKELKENTGVKKELLTNVKKELPTDPQPSGFEEEIQCG